MDLHEIFKKGRQWVNEQHWLNLAVIRITVWIQGLFSRFVTIGRYGKCLTDINLLLILIRQMAVLVRRGLAEVRTVPVLLIDIFFNFLYIFTLQTDSAQYVARRPEMGEICFSHWFVLDHTTITND